MSDGELVVFGTSSDESKRCIRHRSLAKVWHVRGELVGRSSAQLPNLFLGDAKRWMINTTKRLLCQKAKDGLCLPKLRVANKVGSESLSEQTPRGGRKSGRRIADMA
ncbi:hypothetical protein PV10_07279 [Exophiala mesophila]|uniref:Uncharacterized protein n=1 Tax=Exophiala mesophila TaxID=212818 RepID=A0A0D1XP94_EXOME|nr:uncharacterized protein PV10_07279 [Exophiala mesophila]KIV89921.1 hypothetical protein PV10_07279 [Exophiala mesophila]